MAQDVIEGLESLSAILPQLNSAMAEATAVVHAVDQFLAEELAIGPWVASRPFETCCAIGEDGRELVITSHLACGRVGGRYRLHVLNATLDRPDGKDQFTQIIGEERTPWLSCSREVRLQSFSMLPEVLSLLAAKINEITSQTSRTVETVREVLKSMGRYPSPNSAAAYGGNGNGQRQRERPQPRTERGHAAVVAADSDEDDRYAGGGFMVNSGSDLFKRPKIK
ncbi:MAG: hypothetical protein U0835_10555 [Isosphaeraceae bacterium]